MVMKIALTRCHRVAIINKDQTLNKSLKTLSRIKKSNINTPGSVFISDS